MNIEGAEQEALAGARLTLSKYHPALAIAADHMPDDSYAIPALVNRSWPGYRSVSAGSLREVAGHVVPEGASLQPGHRPQPIETSHEPLANHEKAGRITAGYAARCRLILGENGSHVG